MLRSQEFDVICVTETWFHSAVPNNIILDGCPYSVFRTDRPAASGSSRGGGVCILTSNWITKAVFKPVPPAYSNLELCVVDLLFPSSRLRLFVCYRPPSSISNEPSVKYMRDLCGCIHDLYPVNSVVITCGDFNLPNIDWSVTNCSRCNEVTCSDVFLEFFSYAWFTAIC